MVYGAPDTRLPRTRNRALRWTVIIVLSLLVLLVAVDRGGELVAENIAASKLQSSQNLPNKPDVEIDGIPFLTQFASGKYDEVELSTTDVPIGKGDTSLTLSKVNVDLHDMTVSDNFSKVNVALATAVATVDYDDLSRTLGVDLSYVGDGKVRASKKISIFGQTITPTITASPRFAGGALEFVASAANGLGPLAGELARVTSEVFGTNVPLQGIPFDVRIQDVSIGRDGLRLELRGTDVSYNG